MCLSKSEGGLRCHSHSKAALEKAQAHLSANPDDPQAQAAVAEAEHQLALTATERKRLLEVANNPGLDPVAAVEARKRYDALTAEHDEIKNVSPFNARYDSPEEQISAFRHEIENAYTSLADEEAYRTLLNTMSKFHSYSLTNQVLINAQNPNANRVAGFKKWKDEFERTVKKGEKAIRIFAPSMRNVPVRDAKGQPVMGENGKPETRQRAVGFRVVSVFGDTQTEGKALPTGYELNEAPPEGFVDDLHSAIEAEGYSVSYEDTGFAGGWTSNAKKVVISSALSPAQRAKTLAHELAHIKAGHMERDDYHTGADGCRGEMEMEAESLAYMLCRSNGMSADMSSSTSSYIKGWQQTQPDKSVETVMKGISSTFKDLMKNGSWRNAE